MTAQERFLKRRGETMLLPDGTKCKASLESSTRATYSLANRAYFFEGTMQTGGYATGDYLTREMDGLAYLVETIQPEPPHVNIQAVYLAQCNAMVNLYREGEIEYDENGEKIDPNDDGWRVYAEAVKVFQDTTPRSDKQVNDGRLDQSIYIMHLPHRYGIRKNDRITVVTSDGTPIQKYRIEGINNSLTPIDSRTEGVDVVQLSEDLRIG